jgi:2-polyprenyl-6-methoxyphenol hydroxylase-like FAD-dependent oxidoreductase
MPGANFQTAKPLPVKSTAVIGAGTMGSGIAVCLLNAGYQVFLLEQNEKVRVHRPKVMLFNKLSLSLRLLYQLSQSF